MLEVLIVEDDRRIAEILRRFAEKAGGVHVVGTAHNLAEAVEWLEVLGPDLVLLDVWLPDGQGTELIWHIRRHCRETDIILVTAAGETEVVQEAMRGGVVDYIVKPIAFDRLQNSLRSYRDNRRRLSGAERMDQGEIDRLWSRNPGDGPPPKPAGSEAPKGIDPITLAKVQAVIKAGAGGWTAEEMGREIGASRSTARRYLEHLVSLDRLTADVSYGAVGRPERRYFPSHSLSEGRP